MSSTQTRQEWRPGFGWVARPIETAATMLDAGAEFRAARRGSGLTLRALALESGVSHSTVSRWERGERTVSASVYEHLSRTLADYLAARWAPRPVALASVAGGQR